MHWDALCLCRSKEETLCLLFVVDVTDDGDGDGLGVGAIVGIVIGVLVLVVIIIGVVYYCKSKQSK